MEGAAVPGAAGLGKQRAGSVAAAGDQEQKEVHHGPGHAHSGEGLLPYVPPHNGHIHGVVELLQNIAGQ